MLIFNTYLILTPHSWAIDFFEFREEGMNDTSYKLWLGLTIIVNLALTFVMEKGVIWYLTLWWKRRSDRKLNEQREREIADDVAAMGNGLPNKSIDGKR
jgi:hypothetical protein